MINKYSKIVKQNFRATTNGKCEFYTLYGLKAPRYSLNSPPHIQVRQDESGNSMPYGIASYQAVN